MKNIQKTIAVCLAIFLLSANLSPAFAAEDNPVKKDETSYVFLNPNGSIQEQIVSDWLSSENGFDNYADKSSLSEIENLKSDTEPTSSNGTLVWNTDETNLYYQGTTDEEPPVSVSINYALDGKSIDPSDLEGASGKLKITLRLFNNDTETVDINGESRTIVTPFILAGGAIFPEDSYTNLTISNGTVQNDSKNVLACFVALPGMQKSLSDLIPDELDSLNDYLTDEITIEADVTDATLPSFVFAAATSAQELSDTLDTSSLDELGDATELLQDGSKALNEGIAELVTSLQTFADSYAEFDAGVDSALDGSKQLADGANTLSSGAATLSDKTGELAQGAKTLSTGASTLSNTLNTELLPALSSASAQKDALQNQIGTLSGKLDGLTIPDMSALKSELSAGVGEVFDQAAYNGAYYAAQAVGDQAAFQAGNQVKAGCEQVVDAAAPQIASGISSSYEQAISAVLTQSGAVDEATAAALTQTIMSAISEDAVSSAISGNIDAAIDANVTVPDNAVSSTAGTETDTAAAAASQVVSQMSGAKEQAVGAVSDAVPDINTDELNQMLAQFRDLASDSEDMLGQVDTLTAALYNESNPSDSQTVVGAASALAIGAKTLSDGCDALYDGTKEVASGSKSLASGSNTLMNGLTTLSSSSKQVSSAISQFQSGGDELLSGSAELSDGIDTFAEEAIDELLDTLSPDSTLYQVIDRMIDRAGAYKGTGVADNTDLSVKYVYRTVNPSSSDDSSVEEISTDTEDVTKNQDGFWTRMKNLFSFS